MTRLRTYPHAVVWLLIVASCWAFGADGLHHHSLRIVQSPELAAGLEAGSGCPVNLFLHTMQGGDCAPDLSLKPVLQATELAPLAMFIGTIARTFSANSPRAPPFSS